MLSRRSFVDENQTSNQIVVTVRSYIMHSIRVIIRIKIVKNLC